MRHQLRPRTMLMGQFPSHRTRSVVRCLAFPVHDKYSLRAVSAPQESTVDFGGYVRTRLAASGRSISWLAKESEIKRSHLSEMIHGRRPVGERHALRLAATLEVAPSDILAVAGVKAKPPESAQPDSFSVALEHQRSLLAIDVERALVHLDVRSDGRCY